MQKWLLGATMSVALIVTPAMAQQQQQTPEVRPEQQPSTQPEQTPAAQPGQQDQAGVDQALPSGFKAEPVLKETKTADGDPIQMPTGPVEIVSVIGTIEAGGRTARHQHPVPVYVYVLEGELEVQTEGGEPRQYKQGEAFLESVNQWHQAFNKTDAETKILVVFMGEEGKPTTVTE